MQVNKALDAFVKTLRKDGEVACVVNKETFTREIVEKLFQSVQLGPADIQQKINIHIQCLKINNEIVKPEKKRDYNKLFDNKALYISTEFSTAIVFWQPKQQTLKRVITLPFLKAWRKPDRIKSTRYAPKGVKLLIQFWSNFVQQIFTIWSKIGNYSHVV